MLVNKASVSGWRRDEEASMRNGLIARVTALVVVLATIFGAFAYQAFAQNAVGGPKKPVAVGGAAKQTSPVMPASKGVSTASSSPSKCASGSCVVKHTK
jgi:hypothetical protein